MSVEFFPCSLCGESICDAGEWWDCHECGYSLCIGCAEDNVSEDGETGDDICPFCARDLATDTQLLDFALSKLNMTRDQLLEEYRRA
jgi:hypothetical protein